MFLTLMNIILSIIYCSSHGIKSKTKIVEQICDFGLAKWLPKQWTHHIVSKFEGTFGFVNLICHSLVYQ